jgi:hypothetical protein
MYFNPLYPYDTFALGDDQEPPYVVIDEPYHTHTESMHANHYDQ